MRSPRLFPLLGSLALGSSLIGCATGPTLEELASCDNGSADSDPAHYRWRMRLGSTQLHFEPGNAVDMAIDVGVKIQMVYKADGADVGRSTYLPVTANIAQKYFEGVYNEFLDGKYQLDELTGRGARFEIWSDGFWFLDNHLFSCQVKLDPKAIVENRNGNFGKPTMTPIALDATAFTCATPAGIVVDSAVIQKMDLTFEAEFDPGVAGVRLPLKPADAAGPRGCSLDSPYAHDWQVYVEALTLDDRDQPATISLQATATSSGTESKGVMLLAAYQADEAAQTAEYTPRLLLPMDKPLQFEDLVCPPAAGAACPAGKLAFDLVGDAGKPVATGCHIVLDDASVINAANAWRAGGTNVSGSTLALADGAGLKCDATPGLHDAAGKALPVSLGFVPTLKSTIGATVLDVPGGAAGGGTDLPTDEPDRDGDGRADSKDNCPANSNAGQGDLDVDAIGDACDDDDDGDAALDTADNCASSANMDQLDADTDGKGDVCDPDDDNDTVLDGIDNCPMLANTDQLNTDGDREGDACDSDVDGDSNGNGTDPEPTDPTAGGTDTDGDGKNDDEDNCTQVANEDQLDTDGDGSGDVCDRPTDGDEPTGPDSDNDGTPDAFDNCAGFPNLDQKDSDGDGTGDACETGVPGGGGGGGGGSADDLGDGEMVEAGCSAAGGGAAVAPWFLVLLAPLMRRRRR